MTQIIIQTYQVLDEIRNRADFVDLKKQEKQMMLNCAIAIELFQSEKKNYEEVMSRGGVYHPDYQKTIKAFSKAKAFLYEKKEVKDYLKQEKKVQTQLDELLLEITTAVSSYIKIGFSNKGGSCNACK